MKIAQISPLYEAVPPSLYGGTERVVAHLTDALTQLGHKVTLFAAAGARTRAVQVACRDQPLRLDPDPLKSDLAAHLNMLHMLRERQDEFDILHFHTDLIHFPLFESVAARTMTTLHGRLDLKDLGETYRRWRQFALVSISQHQRRPLPFANWLATVPHGLDIPAPARIEAPADGGYLAFLGRISPEKRPDRAIAIARKAGLPLKIAAKVDAADRHYYETEIRPLLRQPGIEFIGEIGDADKTAFLAGARALLFPIDWPEPFGLVMIEAMARGTPVIAWRCGSVPEVIDHGITGWVVDSEDEAVRAVEQAASADRTRIRDVFERRFSALSMAQRYESLYRRLLAPTEQTEPLLQVG